MHIIHVITSQHTPILPNPHPNAPPGTPTDTDTVPSSGTWLQMTTSSSNGTPAYTKIWLSVGIPSTFTARKQTLEYVEA